MRPSSGLRLGLLFSFLMQSHYDRCLQERPPESWPIGRFGLAHTVGSNKKALKFKD